MNIALNCYLRVAVAIVEVVVNVVVTVTINKAKNEIPAKPATTLEDLVAGSWCWVVWGNLFQSGSELLAGISFFALLIVTLTTTLTTTSTIAAATRG